MKKISIDEFISRVNERKSVSRFDVELGFKWGKTESEKLCSIDLSYAYLHGVDFGGADLHGANLRGADLSYADLSYANFNGADLHGANFHNADLRYITGAKVKVIGLKKK